MKFLGFFAIFVLSLLGARLDADTSANVTLKAATFDELIGSFREKYHVAVCLEQMPKYAFNATTYGREIANLSTLQQDRLTSEQKAQLDYARMIQARHIAVSLPRSFTSDQALDEIIHLDGSYEFIKDNTIYLIKPKLSMLKSKAINFEITNATPAIAYKALLEDVLQPNHIMPHGDIEQSTTAPVASRGAYFTTLNTNQLLYPYYNQTDKSLSLKIESATIYTILNRFVESFGPSVYWVMIPHNDTRNQRDNITIMFGDLNSKRKWATEMLPDQY